MTRFLAVLFGIAFIFIGVAGFLPTFSVDGMLFGYFTPTSMHNIVHIVTGVVAIMAATSHHMARLFFQLLGLVYAIAAVWGFWLDGDLVVMQVTMADNILHLIVAVLALLIGFSSSKER